MSQKISTDPYVLVTNSCIYIYIYITLKSLNNLIIDEIVLGWFDSYNTY